MTLSYRVLGGFAAVLVIGLGTMAGAETSDEILSPAAVVKTAAGQGEARFDWLNPGKDPAPTRVVQSIAPGTGSWICSPSGFGSKSSCTRR